MNAISQRAATALDHLAAGVPKKQVADYMNINSRTLVYALAQARLDANCKTTYELLAEYSKGQINVKESK